MDISFGVIVDVAKDHLISNAGVGVKVIFKSNPGLVAILQIKLLNEAGSLVLGNVTRVLTQAEET